jgi:endoglucanase
MRFEELTQLHGVSGYETEVREAIQKEIEGDVDEIVVDSIGNLIALRKGHGERKKRVMLSAHMDEIGFQVIKVLDNGLLMIKTLGHSFLHIAYGSRVRFRNGMTGVVSSRVPADKLGKDFTDLTVDIGANSKEEALKFVDVGDVACYVGEFTPLVGRAVLSKAVDDRVGCHMMMEAMKRFPRPYHDVYYVFSVQEEVGCRGAKVAAARIDPEIGIAVDVTPHHDRPGDLEGSNRQGGGIAVKISDTSVICDERIVRKMLDLCARESIPCQKEVLYVGGCDASAINLAGEGIRVGAVSVVTRYTHGPGCMVDLDDVEAGILLLGAFLGEEIDS